jgi:two-component system invasion response regulator UvrY
MSDTINEHTMINILIADDHVLVREGLKKVIKSGPGLVIAGEASNASEALKFLDKQQVDVLVLDISMPGKTGLDLLKDVKILYPDLPVLILSMHSEERYAIRALKSGAAGYITKESAADELVKAILKVNNGGKYISASLAERLASELVAPQSKEPHELLSDREFQVMCEIASGKSSNEIADKLSLGLSTVNTYRSRILAKLNLKSTTELIRYAVKHSLIDEE